MGLAILASFRRRSGIPTTNSFFDGRPSAVEKGGAFMEDDTRGGGGGKYFHFGNSSSGRRAKRNARA
jgi:hypothetical protein